MSLIVVSPPTLENTDMALAQGHTSALIAGVLHRHAVASIGGDLAARLDGDDTAFLDVGGHRQHPFGGRGVAHGVIIYARPTR